MSREDGVVRVRSQVCGLWCEFVLSPNPDESGHVTRLAPAAEEAPQSHLFDPIRKGMNWWQWCERQAEWMRKRGIPALVLADEFDLCAVVRGQHLGRVAPPDRQQRKLRSRNKQVLSTFGPVPALGAV